VVFSTVAIHSAAIGNDGPIVRDLTGDFVGNTAKGIWTDSDGQPLTDTLVEQLLLGDLYINVTSAAHPSGELRGQIKVASGVGLSAFVDGDQEVPPVVSTATGLGTFTLTDAGLIYHINVEGLTIDMAHFHLAAEGINGPVVRSLTTEFSGGKAAGIWTAQDTEPLTASLTDALLAGEVYVNIHTAMHPGGEIRGQLVVDEGSHLYASLDGDEVVVATGSTAFGLGSFSLADTGLHFDVSLSGITPTAVHFLHADIGVSGPPVRTITGDFIGNTASGVWRSTDAEPLTNDLITALLTGKLYINVHTATHPSGEIRGQVLLSAGEGYTGDSDGSQQVPPIPTSSTATGAYTLTPAGLVFDITAEGFPLT